MKRQGSLINNLVKVLEKYFPDFTTFTSVYSQGYIAKDMLILRSKRGLFNFFIVLSVSCLF